MCISQRQPQVDCSAANRHRSSVGCKRRWVDIMALEELDCFLMGSGKTLEFGDSRNGLTPKGVEED